MPLRHSRNDESLIEKTSRIEGGNTLYPTFLFYIGNSLFERPFDFAQGDNGGKAVRASLVSLAFSPSKRFVGAVLLVSFITIQNAIKPFIKILLVGV